MNSETQISTTDAQGPVRARTPSGGRRNRERTCLVSREVKPESDLIRFVRGPDGAIVPDLQARLPGRGVWVTARRRQIDEAVKRKLFGRGLKAEVTVPADLGRQTADLLASAALGRLGLARKAGQVVAGFAKVSAAVEKDQAVLILVASDAAEDGRRKMEAAIRRRFGADAGPRVIDRWSSAEMSLAIGRTNVIHAAVLDGAAGQGFKQAAMKLLAFEEPAGEDAGEPQDSDV